MKSRARRRAERILQATALAVVATTLVWWTQLPQQVAADDPFLRRTATVRAVEKVGPAVVNIMTERVVHSPFQWPRSANPLAQPYFEQFFPPRTSTLESLGSGVVIDARGHILTNQHVIAQDS